jgi:hypothetical protein
MGTQSTTKSAAQSPATRESHILAGWEHRTQQIQQHSHQQQRNHTYLLEGDTEYNKISSTVTSNKGITHTAWEGTQSTTNLAAVTSNKGITHTAWKGTQNTTKSAAQSPATGESHIQSGRGHRNSEQPLPAIKTEHIHTRITCKSSVGQSLSIKISHILPVQRIHVITQ